MLITFKRYKIVIRFEVIFWVTALLLLACMKPDVDAHYSFCILKFIGFQKCPGCGLGHSISFLFHGDIRKSLDAHPLGIFALIVIFAYLIPYFFGIITVDNFFDFHKYFSLRHSTIVPFS